MPASQPVDHSPAAGEKVDYVAFLHREAKWSFPDEAEILGDLATKLTALREAVKIINDRERAIGDRYNASRRLEVTIAALTHTTQGGEK